MSQVDPTGSTWDIFLFLLSEKNHHGMGQIIDQYSSYKQSSTQQHRNRRCRPLASLARYSHQLIQRTVQHHDNITHRLKTGVICLSFHNSIDRSYRNPGQICQLLIRQLSLVLQLFQLCRNHFLSPTIRQFIRYIAFFQTHYQICV